jgi:RNA polymerase sigma-70 factor, ECF subfamily
VSIRMSGLPSDEELVTRAQAGDDPLVLEALIDSIRPAVLRYCRSQLSTYAGGWDAADDAAQEIYAGVVQAIPTYHQQGRPFVAFVFSIAANKVADARRRFSRSPICVDEIPEQTEPSPTPEEQAITSARFDALHQLLDRLPERMREVLLLRAAGVSAEMVGEQCGMSASAVRVAHHRAVAKLRLLIQSSDEHRDLFDTERWRERSALRDDAITKR